MAVVVAIYYAIDQPRRFAMLRNTQITNGVQEITPLGKLRTPFANSVQHISTLVHADRLDEALDNAKLDREALVRKPDKMTYLILRFTIG